MHSSDDQSLGNIFLGGRIKVQGEGVPCAGSISRGQTSLWEIFRGWVGGWVGKKIVTVMVKTNLQIYRCHSLCNGGPTATHSQ